MASDRHDDAAEPGVETPAPTAADSTAAESAAADSAATESVAAASAEAARVEFPVVGVGASAGGLEALEALTRRLSSDGMAIVVVQHLAPGHERLLADILARGTSLPVVTAHDGVELERNTIYVTPPSVEIALRGKTLHLTEITGHAPRHTIDVFFRSLAAEAGAKAIGVVLSGAGTDGTLGLRAIKDADGITFAQEPSTASQPSMPQSAVDASCADFCLSPAAIGDELMRLGAHPYVAQKRPPDIAEPERLTRLFEQLRRAFGVDFSAYKLGTVERRIERRMALHKLDSFEAYLRFLESNPAELGLLYSDLLVGVTGFFRDGEPFDALKTVVFPRLFDDRRADVPVRFWVAGCSTGEEAYSLAITLLEYLGDRVAGFKVQIFGTDIDDAALARARLASYPQSIETEVSAERLQRFFSRQDGGYLVSRQVRDMVVFARHDLGKDPPFSRLDLVSCRNVLIYLQPHLQRKVLRVLHYALNPEGFLLLGKSESVGDASEFFSLVDRKLKIYVKKNTASSAVFDFVSGLRPGEATAEPQPRAQFAERRPLVSVQQLADRKVLDKFGPPGILIDDALDIIQFRGQMRPYLGPSPGAATLSALKVIRPELLLELRAGVAKAAADKLPVTSAPVTLWGDEGGAAVVLEVMPLQEADAQAPCFLVLFRELAPGDVEAARAQEPRPPREPRVEELEHELLVTKEYLQTSVQELEGANQELQSANEELQSSNEELQSTNEELSTSKEELQSTNEELATVNDELSTRMAELTAAKDDLDNVLACTSVPLVIVGMDLRVRRFSSAAERLLNLVADDVGRPVGYLGTAVNAPQLESLVADAIKAVRERAQRVRGSDGRWYTARVSPYRTSEHAIRGAIVELSTAPHTRRPGEPVEIHEFVGKVLSTLPHVLMLLDEQLRIAWVNKSFFETFVVGAEVLGRALDDVWPGRGAHPELWNALEECVAGGPPVGGLVVEHPFGRKSERAMAFSARFIPGEGDRPAVTLVVMEEMPEEGGRS